MNRVDLLEFSVDVLIYLCCMMSIMFGIGWVDKQAEEGVQPPILEVQGSISGEISRREKPQKITVFVYENNDQLQQAYKQAGYEGRINGYSLYKEKDEVWGCKIHVTKIKKVEDRKKMATWGHELAHCIYGSYHK